MSMNISQVNLSDFHLKRVLLAAPAVAKAALELLQECSPLYMKFPDMVPYSGFQSFNPVSPLFWLVVEANGFNRTPQRLAQCSKCHTELTVEQGNWCMACRGAVYCSRECYSAHWKEHKPNCVACEQKHP